MIKRSLLAATIATIGAQSAVAAPFMPMDARGLAMGNTGVASAQRAHAPAYNPSLLSQAHESDDFALLFPQIGVNVADEEGLVDEANKIKDEIVPDVEELIEDGGSLPVDVEALADSANTLANTLASVDVTNTTGDAAKANQIRTDNQAFQTNLNKVEGSVIKVQSATDELNKSLAAINGSPLRGRLGIGAALAIPSKKFAAALSLNANITGSGRAFVTQEDRNLIGAYPDATLAYINQAKGVTGSVDTVEEIVRNGIQPGDINKLSSAITAVDDVRRFQSDPVNTASGTIRVFENGQVTNAAQDLELNSQVQIKAMAVADLGLSLSREFEFFGEKIAIGITPKLQKIETFHFVTELDNKDKIEDKDIEDSRTSYSKVNLDIGASYRFGSENKWMIGVVGKNLMGGEFDVADAKVKGATNATVKGGQVVLNPQYRAGIAFNGDWTILTADIDLTENEPVGFEKATQYAAVGAELDIFDTIQFRAGYRTNLKGSDDEAVSVGFGLSPFGIHLDLAVMANPNDPEKEAGVALETGFYF